jgi:hypothetical protein
MESERIARVFGTKTNKELQFLIKDWDIYVKKNSTKKELLQVISYVLTETQLWEKETYWENDDFEHEIEKQFIRCFERYNSHREELGLVPDYDEKNLSLQLRKWFYIGDDESTA